MDAVTQAELYVELLYQAAQIPPSAALDALSQWMNQLDPQQVAIRQVTTILCQLDEPMDALAEVAYELHRRRAAA